MQDLRDISEKIINIMRNSYFDFDAYIQEDVNNIHILWLDDANRIHLYIVNRKIVIDSIIPIGSVDSYVIDDPDDIEDIDLSINTLLLYLYPRILMNTAHFVLYWINEITHDWDAWIQTYSQGAIVYWYNRTEYIYINYLKNHIILSHKGRILDIPDIDNLGDMDEVYRQVEEYITSIQPKLKF